MGLAVLKGTDIEVIDVLRNKIEGQLGLLKLKRSPFAITGEELLNLKIEKLPYLVEGLLPQTGAVALAGSSDTGKTSLLRQLACKIVYGDTDFLGFDLNARHKSVIYVSTEDDSQATSFLLNMQKDETKKASDLKGLRFIFDSEGLLDKLDKELKNTPADCVIIDTFTDIYGGDMNASNKIRSFINDYSNLSKKHNCLLIFLHHTGKRTEMIPPSKDNLLGSQGFEAKMRLVLELRRDYKDYSKRHLCIVKGNYIPDNDKDHSYVLNFDDSLRYTRLDERVPFHMLAKPEIKQEKNGKAKDLAITLKQQGMSIDKIKEEMERQGIHIGRSTIGNWVKECPSIQESLDGDGGLDVHPSNRP